MSSTQPKKEKLLAEFPPVSYDDWRKLVEVELKGAPFDKKMFTATYEGITLKPIYRKEDTANLPHVNSFPGFAPFVRGTRASGYVKQPWDVAQDVISSSAAEFNQSARTMATHGVSALNMVLDSATRKGMDPDSAKPGEVGVDGVSVSSLPELEQALDGLDLEKTSLNVRCGSAALPFAAVLVAFARKHQKPLTNVKGCIEADPLGCLAGQGALPQSLDSAYRELAALTAWAAKNAPQIQTFSVHSCPWHEAGGSAVQELAFVLATGVEYLREMNKRGLTVNAVAPRIRFSVTVGVNFFTEISKLRALKMLWANAIKAIGGNEAAQKLSLHVRTSRRNKTVVDPYNNMLRTTVEAFAGMLGGCDSMQVGAFDEVLRRPDDFSQRIARNSQLVLQKECNLDHVIDPVGGSWFVESLTSEIANRAWALFQEVEKKGGMAAALKEGFPQQAVTATGAERIKSVTRRKDSVVGVNQYANIKEKPLERPVFDAQGFFKSRSQQVASYRTSQEDAVSRDVLKKLEKIVAPKDSKLFETCVEAITAGATIGEVTRSVRIHETASETVTPVKFIRTAEPVEQLRAAMEAYVAKGNERPALFFCNMGALRDYKARADFSRGYLSVGGYSILSSEGFKTPEDAVAAFVKSKSKVAVICSTDPNYPTLVPPLAKGIRAANPDAYIILAGFPQDQIEAHKQAGVNEFIHIRADVCETLHKLHSKLGIE